MLLHRNIQKFAWISDGKTHKRIDYILIDGNGIQVYLMCDRSWQQIVLLVAKVRDQLRVSKQRFYVHLSY
jgi:hypothetical protein